MGVFDSLRRLTGTRQTTPNPLPNSFAPYAVTSFNMGDLNVRDQVMGMSPSQVWRTQPHLRTVVTFMARNIAQLGLQTFKRVGDNDRQRVRDGALATLLSRPNATTTGYELVFGTVADLALYDRAFWHWTESNDSPSGFNLYRLPPTWVTAQGGDAFGYDSYLVAVNGGANKVSIPADRVLDFHGWDPTDTRTGSSPVAALKHILAEQLMAVQHREQVWQRGGRVSAVITRPPGATWSDAARENFRSDWKTKYTGDGPDAGGTPILEDGMTINRLDFNAHESQFVEASKLALSAVAGAYHVNPTMVGVLDNANYSNVREFRKMLYGDTLGPVMAQLEDRLNTFLVPILDPRPGIYVEFNIGEKLQGSFEEQTQALQAAVGRPWMTADEARGRVNLPSLGGDAEALVTPLNVLVGGQASPQDSTPKGSAGTGAKSFSIGPAVKDRAPSTYEAKHVEVLTRFMKRQQQVVKTGLGSKAGDAWWDQSRWDGELSDDLFRLAVLTAKQVSTATLDAIGFEPDVYDEDRTLAWLREVSDRSATSINGATKAQIDAALADPLVDGEGSDPVNHVYAVAVASRVPSIAASAVTLLSSFASHEAAKQAAGDQAVKTWITGSNPRAAHAAMNGQTVPLPENFSNGAAWPGDGSTLGADDLAGCNCSLSISIP